MQEATAVLKRYAREGMMDGHRRLKLAVEKPIEKPDLPLPGVFSSGIGADMPTRKRRAPKAHFYRRRVSESGMPIYDFYISDEAEH